jgi:hypothetical protein
MIVADLPLEIFISSYCMMSSPEQFPLALLDAHTKNVGGLFSI